MKNLKKGLFTLIIGLQFMSCGGNDDNIDKTSKERSITKAYFTKTYLNFRDTYFLYDLGNVLNNGWAAEVSVEGYNSAYNYEIKIKGDILKEEYTLPLQFSKIDDTNATVNILDFVKEQFKAKVDSYKAYIVEKESNTELEISIPPTSPNRPYIMVDGDEDGFLYTFFFSAERTTSAAVLTELNLPTRQSFDFFFGGSWVLANGLTLSVEIYDLNLNKLGEVATHRFVTSNNVVGYWFSTSNFNNVIPNTGEYFLRLKGSSTGELRYSPYKKINIIK
ncbi:hypothetical protein [uncultured Tenacibaculum sp.]|uniref:hypothetical protein n=1 Tax=uncultured Tenacibaculum sp. TaxID=174713 RepID=UPI0026341780|nr:hypothetical protein [uncultured Tenacibaculum sp.]